MAIGKSCILLSYVLLDGRKITGTLHSRSRSAGSSIVKVRSANAGAYAAGEIRALFLHSLPGSNPAVFAEIAWMDYLGSFPVENDPWTNL